MKIHLTASGFALTSELEKYTANKLEELAGEIPRALRPQAACEVAFSQTTQKDVKFSTCSLKLKFDDTELSAKETTQHMYVALDIVCVHAEHQLKQFSRAHKHGLRAHLKRRGAAD